MKTISMSLDELKAYLSEVPNSQWVFYRGKDRTDTEDIAAGRFKIRGSTAWTGDWTHTPKKKYDRIAHWNDRSQILYVGEYSEQPPEHVPIKEGVDTGEKRWKIPLRNVQKINVMPKSDKPVGLRKIIDAHPQIVTYWSHSASSKVNSGAKTPDSNLLKELQALNKNAKTEVRREIWCRTSAHKKYRDQLLKYWNGQCSLTGFGNEALLIASHIKPWSESEDDKERINVNNGLLLVAPVDKLFDLGYISFSDDGGLLLHKDKLHDRYLTDMALSTFGLTRRGQNGLRKSLNIEQKVFLQYHRTVKFFRS